MREWMSHPAAAMDGMTTNTDRRLATVATGQLGAFRRDQAHVAGCSDDQLRRRVESGTFDQIGPNAFRSRFVPRSAIGDLTALMLDVGAPCWASGATAAALHGFDGFVLRAPFHVTLERARNVRRLGHVIHTTGILPLIDQSTVAGLRATSAGEDHHRSRQVSVLRATRCGARFGDPRRHDERGSAAPQDRGAALQRPLRDPSIARRHRRG